MLGAQTVLDCKKGQTPMNVLLVWEQIPEAHMLYLFEDVTAEELVKFVACHEKFINCDDITPKMEWLNTVLGLSDPVDWSKPLKIDEADLIIIFCNVRDTRVLLR